MKAYKIKVSIQTTITVYEDEFKAEDNIGQEFNEFTAQQYAKGAVVENLHNDPNYGNTKVIDEFEYELQ